MSDRTDNLTRDQRSKTMRAIRSKDTQIELLLRKELSRRGHRYRLHCSTIAGRPDIAFPRRKVAVFCDSEFFHGYEWEESRKRIRSNRDYWIPKIEGNIERDAAVTEKLREDGWLVLRFWGHEIRDDLEGCVERIEEAVAERS